MAARGRHVELVLAGIWLGLATAAAGGEADHVTRAGGIEIVHAWSRATDEDVGVLFMEIANEGTAGDRLVGARSAVASRVELHGAVMRGGRMTSEPIGSLALPAGSELELEPDGAFLKLIGLKQALREGDEYITAIEFAEAGAIEIHVQIEAADATRHSHAGHAH